MNYSFFFKRTTECSIHWILHFERPSTFWNFNFDKQRDRHREAAHRGVPSHLSWRWIRRMGSAGAGRRGNEHLAGRSTFFFAKVQTVGHDHLHTNANQFVFFLVRELCDASSSILDDSQRQKNYFHLEIILGLSKSSTLTFFNIWIFWIGREFSCQSERQAHANVLSFQEFWAQVQSIDCVMKMNSFFMRINPFPGEFASIDN